MQQQQTSAAFCLEKPQMSEAFSCAASLPFLAAFPAADFASRPCATRRNQNMSSLHRLQLNERPSSMLLAAGKRSAAARCSGPTPQAPLIC